MPDRLKAKCRLPYGRNVYFPGEYFIASSVDARTLVATGKADRADEEDPVPALLTRNLEPLTESRGTYDAPSAVEPEQKRKRGRPRKGEYLTRDMSAK